MAGLLAVLKHDELLGPGWLLDACVELCDFFQVIPVARPSDLPPPEACAAVLLLGPSIGPGPFEARDRLLREELVFVRTVVGLGASYLGLGRGAEVLCWALRGRVLGETDDRLGPDRLSLGPAGAADPILGAAGAELPVVRLPAHRLVLPPTAVLLAGTAEAPEAFRLGEAAHGLVPHLEPTPLMLREWLEASGLSGREDAARAVELAEVRQDEQREAARRVLAPLVERARSFCPDRPLVSDDDEPIVPL